MKGSICAINKDAGVVAVEPDDGDYSIFEVLGGHDFEVDDEVS
jgi:hypothetical protein